MHPKYFKAFFEPTYESHRSVSVRSSDHHSKREQEFKDPRYTTILGSHCGIIVISIILNERWLWKSRQFQVKGQFDEPSKRCEISRFLWNDIITYCLICWFLTYRRCWVVFVVLFFVQFCLEFPSLFYYGVISSICFAVSVFQN